MIETFRHLFDPGTEVLDGIRLALGDAPTWLRAIREPLIEHVHGSPIVWLVLTLLAFGTGEWVNRRTGNALANSVLLAALGVWLCQWLTASPTHVYDETRALLAMFLAPITVALAVPAYHRIADARRCWPAIAVAVVAGGAIAIVVTCGVAKLLGGSTATLLALAPRATTAAVSVEWARLLGAATTLTALVTIGGGIVGAVIGTWLLATCNVRDERSIGLALGVASHAIGTSRAFEVSETAGAFAAIGLAANAIFTSLLLAGLMLAGGTRP